MTAQSADLASSETVRTVFVRGLQNAHALEKEAMQIMNRQIERLEHYPQMKQLLLQVSLAVRRCNTRCPCP